LSLPRLSCTRTNGGAFNPPVADFVECEAPKASGETGMRLWTAMTEAKIRGDAAMMRAYYALSNVRCRSTQEGITCTAAAAD
jgi:hypothetical protein